LIRAKVLPFPDVGDDGDFQQFSISPIFGNLPCVSFVSFVVSGFAFPIAAMTGAPGKPAFGFLGWDHGDSGDRRASARHPSPSPSIRIQKDLVAFIPGVRRPFCVLRILFGSGLGVVAWLGASLLAASCCFSKIFPFAP
jgi:hypothetical protein